VRKPRKLIESEGDRIVDGTVVLAAVADMAVARDVAAAFARWSKQAPVDRCRRGGEMSTPRLALASAAAALPARRRRRSGCLRCFIAAFSRIDSMQR
jgi:hypothetical protein